MATRTWTDTGSVYPWDDPLGWDTGIDVPVNGDTVIFPTGTTAPTGGPASPISLQSLTVQSDSMSDLSNVTIASGGSVNFSGMSANFNGAYSGTCSGTFAGGTINSGSGTLTTGVFNETSTNGGVVTDGTFNDSSTNTGLVTNLTVGSSSIVIWGGTATNIILPGTVAGSTLTTNTVPALLGNFTNIVMTGIPPATGGGGGPLGGPAIVF